MKNKLEDFGNISKIIRNTKEIKCFRKVKTRGKEERRIFVSRKIRQPDCVKNYEMGIRDDNESERGNEKNPHTQRNERNCKRKKS